MGFVEGLKCCVREVRAKGCVKLMVGIEGRVRQGQTAKGLQSSLSLAEGCPQSPYLMDETTLE